VTPLFVSPDPGSASTKDHGHVPIAWNKGPLPKGGTTIPKEGQEKAKKLYRLSYDCRN